MLTVDSVLAVCFEWVDCVLTTLTVSNEFERVNVRLRVSMCVCGTVRVSECVGSIRLC